MKVEEMKATEMRMLRSICGKTLKGKTSNEKFRKMMEWRN